MGYLGRNAVYEYTVEYDENVLFPAKYKINSTGIRDARGILSGYDVLQIYADKELTEKISVVDSQTIKAGEDPNKMNVQTVEFGYSTRMKEVFISVPDYIVYAELAEPIRIDVSEAFKANQGEIIEKPIYIDGELAYTVKSCKAEPDKDGNVYIAVLVIPEAEQKFNIDGEFGNGTNYNEKTSNLIVDRVVHDGKKYYSNEDLVAKCEKLLGIEADDLDDNCALFYPLMWKAEKSEIDKILNDPFLFEIDTITARIEGGVKTINPNDCKAK